MTKRFNRRIDLLFLVALSVSLPLTAVDTSFWEVSTYESFLQGTLENISLSRDGQLRLSPESKSIFDPDETLVLSLVRDDEGWLYFGTGHQGKVFRIDEEGEGKLLFTAPEPDIFALALGLSLSFTTPLVDPNFYVRSGGFDRFGHQPIFDHRRLRGKPAALLPARTEDHSGEGKREAQPLGAGRIRIRPGLTEGFP